MESVRKPFTGVLNIIRFNWHFYVLAILLAIGLLLLTNFLPKNLIPYCFGLAVLILVPLLLSLAISYYVYDFSNLYELPWLKDLPAETTETILNLHAGFDETSFSIEKKFKSSKLIVFDFYNPEKHTEVSIERAQKLSGKYPGTIGISTDKIPLADNSVDKILITFAAHEIRNEAERIAFFKELHRVLKRGGRIFITEHLRDTPNFVAYTIGFFHFYQRKNWLKIFKKVNLQVVGEIKTTPFVSTFVLKNHTN